MGTTDTSAEQGFNPEQDCKTSRGVCERANYRSLGGPCVDLCDVVRIENELVIVGIATRIEENVGDYDPDMLRRLAGGNSPTATGTVYTAVYPFAPLPRETSAIENEYVPDGGFA